ncbi:MAG: histidine phosphatase family protein [Bacteroidia bacterium]
MKTIYFIRHAKSDWSNTGLTDFDRPLNLRGYTDAHKMSLSMKEQAIFPELIITSPAIRAISTAMIFAENLDFNFSKITINKKLYASTVNEYVDCVKKINNQINTAFLFGHNPSISDCVNSFTTAFTGELSTCAMVGLEFKVEDWENISSKNGSFSYYNYPKKLIKKENS